MTPRIVFAARRPAARSLVSATSPTERLGHLSVERLCQMQFLYEWEAVRAKRPDAESRVQEWADDDEGACPSFRCTDEQHCFQGF
jgi:hypothetical protein